MFSRDEFYELWLEYIKKNRALQRRTLYAFIRAGDLVLMKKLMSAGMDLNFNRIRRSPLHFAVYRKNKDAIALLLKKGASPAFRDRKNRTAPEYAAYLEKRAKTPADRNAYREIRELLRAN